MRFLELCTVLSLLNGALTAPAVMSEREFAKTLLRNPHIVPPRSLSSLLAIVLLSKVYEI
jgi:hypothetical protein